MCETTEKTGAEKTGAEKTGAGQATTRIRSIPELSNGDACVAIVKTAHEVEVDGSLPKASMAKRL